jgi:hypothetical protein
VPRSVFRQSRRVLVPAVLSLALAASLLAAGPLQARGTDAVVEITGGPSGETTSTDAIFTWKLKLSASGFSYRCKLDSKAEETCTSPKHYHQLSLGSHRFVVRALDRSGTQRGSDSRSWKVIEAPPPTTTTTETTPKPPESKGPLPPLARAIKGTAGNDVLRGTPGNDVIFGLGGNDRIYGGGGADILVGGPGADVLVGGAGNDKLIGGPGADTFLGGPGNDSIYAVDGARDKRVEGGSGRDRFYHDPGESSENHLPTPGIETGTTFVNRPIVFGRDGRIYTMTVGGGSVKRIFPPLKAKASKYNSDPVWSPDGTRIAFVHSEQAYEHREGGGSASDIWVMSANGSHAQAVTQTSDFCEREPEWSPDGTRIVYYRAGCAGNNSSDEKLVHKALDLNATPWIASFYLGYGGISWRADGAYLYAAYCTYRGAVYRVDPWGSPSAGPWDDPSAGTVVTPLQDGYCGARPAISPTQPYQLLYTWFTSGWYEAQNQPLPSGPTQGIHLKSDSAAASIAGTLLVGFGPVVPGWGINYNFNSSWSPDGQKIVFSRGGELWRMNKDGSGQKDLGVQGYDPDWR